MEAEDIKTISDMQRFIEGCLNDFESGISTKEETLENLRKYTFHIIEIVEKKFTENNQPPLLNRR